MLKFEKNWYYTMEIINAHAHIYPEKIASKATDTIGKFYDIKMQSPAGTPENLLKNGLEAGITGYIVHSCATKPHQVRSINEFILKEITEHKEFVGFMTLHQDLTEEEISEEIAWCIDKGFKGIKLHPDFQFFNIDDEKVEKIYRCVSACGKNFPILFHIGDDRYDYSKPFRLSNIAKKYKNVNFIAAHFGGYRCWHEVGVYEGLDNIYFDTSSSLPFISNELAESLIKKFGVEKFFFGDDFPMWNAKEELNRFNSLKLTQTEKEMILAKNIKNFLEIK